MPRRAPFIFVLCAACGICTREQALRGGLFVAGRAVDLAGEIEIVNRFGLKRGFQPAWIEVVVFNGIARA